MDLGLIRAESPLTQQPATPPPQSQGSNSSGWGIWSTITSTAATVTGYVTGAGSGSEDDRKSLANATVSEALPALYLDRATQPDTRKPVNPSDYRRAFAQAGSYENASYPGYYLPVPTRNAANAAYRYLCSGNEKAFLTELTALEAKLQFAVLNHVRDKAVICELRTTLETKQDELKKNQEAAATQGRRFDTFYIDREMSDLRDRMKTMENRVQEEAELLRTVTTCLNDHGSVAARTEAVKQLCTIQNLKAAMKGLIENQNMEITDDWAKPPKQEFRRSWLTPPEQKFYDLLDSDTATIAELMSGFIETISAVQKYKNSVADLENLLSVFERFCFVMVATHKDEHEYKGGMQRFRDFNVQLKDDIVLAKNYEKHRKKEGRKNLQQLAALYNSQDQSKKLEPKAAELLEAVAGFLQANEPTPEESVFLTPDEQALYQALDGKTQAWGEILPLFFGKVLPMDKYSGARVDKLMEIFTEFMSTYKDVHELTDSAGKSSYNSRSLYKDMERLHLSCAERYAPATESTDQTED